MISVETVSLAGPLTDGAEFAHELELNTGNPLPTEP
jgi:hypothetical protein